MVLRRIETRIPTIDELNLPAIVKSLAMTKRGIIIFVGATGTGKSTSLAAMIGYRNQNSTGHIITIEDPIEYVHKHEGCIITQRELGIDTDSWENALKNTLRQAPDVIMIGEVRTRETMEHAINFSETGHLCLCTPACEQREPGDGPHPPLLPEDRRNQLFMDLSLNLKGVVAQQLIPTPDGKARRVAMEVMLGTPLVQDYIRKGEIHKLKDVMKESTNLGMKTFDQSLFELYQAGEISYEDALRYADSANEVRLKIKLAQGGDAHTLSQGMDGVELVETGVFGFLFVGAGGGGGVRVVVSFTHQQKPPPQLQNGFPQAISKLSACAPRGMRSARTIRCGRSCRGRKSAADTGTRKNSLPRAKPKSPGWNNTVRISASRANAGLRLISVVASGG